MRTTRKRFGLLAAALVLGLASCSPARKAVQTAEAPKPPQPAKPVEPEKPKTPTTVPPGEWLPLFDGRSLDGWKVLKQDDFSLAGKLEVKDGCIILAEGMPFTGIQWTDDFPKEDFEVAWEGRRTMGIDIFCGLTVPVGDAHVTMVSGGWGDSVVGLSSIDDRNASDNEFTKVMSFKNDQWFKFRIRVTKAKIECWIDDKQVVDCPREGHKFTIYPELEPCRPLGFFSWSTTGAIRNVDMKRLKPEN